MRRRDVRSDSKIAVAKRGIIIQLQCGKESVSCFFYSCHYFRSTPSSDVLRGGVRICATPSPGGALRARTTTKGSKYDRVCFEKGANALPQFR